jgi:hypothetical protein
MESWPLLFSDTWRAPASAAEKQGAEEKWRILETILRDGSGEGFEMSAMQLGGTPVDARAVVVLRSRLHDSDENILGAAAFALGELKAQEAASDLAALLDSPAPTVRNMAASALAEMDRIESESIIDSLIKQLDDRDELARISAIEALATARSPKAVPKLLEVVTRSRPGIQEYAVATLGTIGDRRALEPLRAMQTQLSQQDLSQRDKGGTRGSDPPPQRLKSAVDEAIAKLDR